MHRRSLSFLASLAALACLGCEPSDPAGITGFRPPLALEGEYSGSLNLSLQGSATSDSRSDPLQLELQPIDSIFNVRGTVKVGSSPPGVVQGTLVGRDSSLVVRLFGSTQYQSLGWAAFLPELLPHCDWPTAEATDATTRVDLARLVMEGHLNVSCVDADLNGDMVSAVVLIQVRVDVRKLNSGGGGTH